MAKSNNNTTIHLHNTPTFYLEYMKNWLAHKKKENANPAEIAIVEDLTTMVGIAVDAMNPVPAEPGTDKAN